MIIYKKAIYTKMKNNYITLIIKELEEDNKNLSFFNDEESEYKFKFKNDIEKKEKQINLS